MSTAIRDANHLAAGEHRGHASLELCRQKIDFYAFKAQFWRKGECAMSKAAYEECLHFWENELIYAERRLVREISVAR